MTNQKLKELMDLISRKENLKTKLINLNDEISLKNEELTNNKDSLDFLVQSIKSIETQVPIIQEELKNWTNELDEIKNNPSMADDIETWENGVSEVKSNLEEKNNELNGNKIKLAELKELVEQQTNENGDLLSKEIDLDKKINEINQKIAHLNSELEKEVFENLSSSNDPNSIKFFKEYKSVLNESLSLAEFLKLAKKYNIQINDRLLELASPIFANDLNANPDFLTIFIKGYFKNLVSETILEIGTDLDSFLVPLSRELDELNSFAIVENEETYDLLNVIYDDCEINWNLDLSSLKQIKVHFDGIIYDIKSLSDIEHVKLEYNDDIIELTDSIEYINLLKSALLLKDTGSGIYSLPSDFLLQRAKDTVFRNLEKFDIYIDAIIDLSTINSDNGRILLILKRKKPSNVFVGDLNSNSAEILLKNLINQKEGKIPQYGSFTDVETFYSFLSFWAKLESQELGKNADLNPLKFSEITEEINMFSNLDNVEHKPNTLYLPFSLDLNVSLSLEKQKDSTNLFAQLVLKENCVLAEYLKHFFQTPLGIKIRESLDVGLSDYNALKFILAQSELFLPDLDSQVDIVSLNSFILDIETRTNYYRKKLWKSPQSVKELKNELESLDDRQSEKKFEQWIENLPYPLASILWASITNPNNERKVKYMLHFFEAFAEFTFAILLSGLASNKRFYEIEASECILDMHRFRDWYFKPTFGNWHNGASCLAKNVRRLLRNNTKRKKCLELFGNPDPEFLHRISEPEIFNILREVNNYRNQWEGHGPIVSDNEYLNRLKILRSALSRIYNVLVDSYENSFLILPVQSSFKDGVHDYTVKKFMTTRPPFRPINIETVKLMDTSKIYLISENQRNPLEILPLILVKDEICYYYNGRDYDSGKARYVSYYYSEEPEILVSMDKFNDVLSLLKPINRYY